MIYYNGSCNYEHSQLTGKAQLRESERLIQHATASLWDREEMSSTAWERCHFGRGAVTSARR